MANYTRFSPADWSGSNMSHYNSADNSRNNSERIRNEAVRLMREREEKTVLTQRDADRRLGERLHDVTFWRSELQVSIGPIRHLIQGSLTEGEGSVQLTSLY
jgi:tektin-3